MTLIVGFTFLLFAFINYRKAFDSVNITHVWHKLLNHHIDGKMFRIIHNLYDNAKYCVRVGLKNRCLLLAIVVSDRKKISLLCCFIVFK